VAPESPLLALGPFYPCWGPSSSLSIYTDCCNTAFFLEGPYATLAGARIPESVRAALSAHEGTILARARAVFTYSEYAGADIERRYGIGPDRRIVAGAGANLTVSPPPRVQRRTQRPFRVLFVGRDFVRKGGPVVASVAGRIRHVDFTVVSTATGTPAAARNLSFHPPVPPERIHDYFLRADAFMFPTRYEPYGLVVCEAMHYSLPVVVSDVGAMPEIVPQRSMVQHVDDVDGFADAIRRLMDDPSLRMRIAEENFERARGMTWGHAAARILDHLFVAS
jgi:glycosyltransferase involved in cell wall biosynthesis